ncbi:MAG: HAMP domain-containing sensor histidine kinase [Bacteroidota bacterium]
MNNPLKEATNLKFYEGKNGVRWIILVLSVIIATGSVLYTNYLVSELKDREAQQIRLYAKTIERQSNQYDNLNLSFVLTEIIMSNNTIPVIYTNVFDQIEHRNIPEADKFTDPEEKDKFLREEVEIMKEVYPPIPVTLKDEEGQVYGYGNIYYKDSFLLTRLKYYPYIQLTVIALFSVIAYLIFNYSKTAEQNQVWVGLAKETAHQLGTPLSSLMAWVEYFKLQGGENAEIAEELTKDVDRLETITSRFSSIGSIPKLDDHDIVDVTARSIAYLEKRVSTRINFSFTSFPQGQIVAKINKSLYEWVIENLCKNAVDAMGGIGSIDIRVLKVNEGKIAIDISDTGKGIPKSNLSRVFAPGYTTKKRGWGLGLTLVKRIIENYHKGKIFVKESEIDKGTTFRILLNA